jgi:hypothetical protein
MTKKQTANAVIQRNWRERQREKGLIYVGYWIKPADRESLDAFVKSLNRSS